MDNKTYNVPTTNDSCINNSFQTVDEEIDLLDIWLMLAKRRKIILFSALLFTIFSIVYALNLPNVYQSEVYLLPPTDSDITQLKILDIHETNVESVYAQAIRNLKSSHLRKRFFDENNLTEYFTSENDAIEPKELIYIDNFKKLLIVDAGEGVPDFVNVSLQGKDPQKTAEWLNNFISFVHKVTVAEILQDLNGKIAFTKESINWKIKSSRAMAAIKKKDTLIVLEENAVVANKLGFKEQKASSQQRNNSGKKDGKLDANSFDTQVLPLYYRGEKALRSEAEAIRKRKSDDPFISELRDLEMRISELDHIELSADKIKAFRIDQIAYVSPKHIKPQRRKIVGIGLVLGLMMGVFGAFLTNLAVASRNEI